MVFKRRDRRPPLTALTEMVFPRGGWIRATQYVLWRLWRLPDPPHRIGRGVAAGIIISFTPLFGLHLIGAWLIAVAIRGNVIAALLATFVGNPLTYPLCAWASLHFGHWLLGMQTSLGMAEIVDTFKAASIEFWDNIRAIFTDEPTRWHEMGSFFRNLFLPDLLGSIPLGIFAGVISHYLTLPVVAAYQKRRQKKLRDRVEKLRREAERAALARDGRAGSGPDQGLE